MTNTLSRTHLKVTAHLARERALERLALLNPTAYQAFYAEAWEEIRAEERRARRGQ